MVRVRTNHPLPLFVSAQTIAMARVGTSHSRHYFLKSNFSNASAGSGPAVPPAGNQLEKKIMLPASVPSGLSGQHKRV